MVLLLFFTIILLVKYKPIRIFFFIGLFMIFLFSNNITIILKIHFREFFQSEFVNGRINDIIMFLEGKSLNEFSSFGNRISNIVTSFNSFIKNPITGNGAFYGLDHLDYGIGNHSQWIDDFC